MGARRGSVRTAWLAGGALLATNLMPANPAKAQSTTWTGNVSNIYGAAVNWSPGFTPNTSTRSAVFTDGGANTNIKANLAVTVQNWIFSGVTTSYSITGAEITFAGNLINTSSVAQSIANNLGGAATVRQNGSGILTLSGVNTYTGDTTIAAGTLQATKSTSVSTTNVVLNGGAFAAGANNLSFSNNIVVGSAGGIIDNANQRLTLTGVISNGSISPGILTLTGGFPNGLTIVSGNNTYSGGTVISNTIVQAGNANALGAGTITLRSGEFRAGSSGALTPTNNFAVDDSLGGGAIDNNGRVLTLTGNITDGNGPGMVTFVNSNMNGTGRTVLLGANTYTGGTAICSCALVQLGDATHTTSLVGAITVDGELDILRADTTQITQIANYGFLLFANNSTASTMTIRNFGAAQFDNTSTAGSAMIVNGRILGFGNHSTAGTATINNNNGIVTFTENSTAGAATINNNATSQPSLVIFSDSSNAGSAQITNSGTSGFRAAFLTFVGNSSASSATIINNAFGGTEFGTNFGTDAPTAGSASITNNANGLTDFNAFSTAGAATITTLSGGFTVFFDNSTGGAARFITNGTGVVDFSGSVGPNGDGRITAGSIEGSGTYYIGAGNSLVAGGNNRSTEVSGLIADTDQCACGTPGPGALEKVGTGTLTLSGANTYSGGTTVTGGVVEAAHATAGSSIDALGTGLVTLGGGTLRTTVTGTLANDVTFAPNTASTLAAATGTVLAVTGTTTTIDGVARFGSATDTGTIVVSGATGANNATIVEVNGGILRAGNFGLTSITGFAASTTVAAGATLDLNDKTAPIPSSGIRNLLGAGNVIIGIDPARTLRVGSGEFSGVISGAGSLVRRSFFSPSASETLILTGANTYTGGTTVMGGTLQLGNGGAGGSILGNVANNGTFAINRSDTYSFDGVISGTGAFQQDGAGRTVLTATSTYTGPTAVNAGTLSVNGSIAASSGVAVNNGATLGGNGIVPTTIINSGGTLSPGNSIGLITVAGNLTFVGAGAYAVEVSPTAADRTNVTGAATLAGTLRVLPQSGSYIPGTRYVLLNAAGGVTGTFGTTDFTSGFGALVRPTVIYDANNVVLDLGRNSVSSVLSNASVNQRNVATALDAGFASGVIPPAFVPLFNLSAASLPGALTQLSGEIGTGAARASAQDMGQFLELMLDPFLENRAVGAGPGFGGPALSFAPDAGDRLPDDASAYARMVNKAPAPALYDPRWTTWGAAFGATGSFDGNAATGSRDLTARSGGFAGGIDYRFSPNTVVGFAASGSSLSYNLDSGLGSGRGDVFKAGLYASTRLDNAYLSASAAFGAYDLTTNRSVFLPGLGDHLTADFSAHSFGGRVEAGYRFPWMGSSGLTPYAAFQGQSFHTPTYSETDATGLAAFALTYGSNTTNESHSELGARIDARFALADNSILLWRGRLGWAHEFLGTSSINAAFQQLPGTGFTVFGAGQGRDALLVSAGAEMKLASGWSLRAKFDGAFSDQSQVYAGTAAIRYAW